MVLLDPVIHLYWAHALARPEEMLKVTHYPMGAFHPLQSFSVFDQYS